jgi:hypothetical protein
MYFWTFFSMWFLNIINLSQAYLGVWALQWYKYWGIILTSSFSKVVNFLTMSGRVFSITHLPRKKTNHVHNHRKKTQLRVNHCNCVLKMQVISVYSPNGPAALTIHIGLNGWLMYTMALTHRGTLYLWATSGGFSGKPHGSASIKCFTLETNFIWF